MSDELRNRLRRQADEVSVPSDDLRDVLSGGSALKWRKRLYSGGAVVLVALLAWTTIPDLLATTRDDEPPPVVGSPKPSPEETPVFGLCESVPFHATYLPEGWSYVLQPGAGGQENVPLNRQTPEALGHYSTITGSRGWIDVMQYGSFYTLPESEGTPIEVLGSTGRIGEIHEGGQTVEFEYRNCEYQMTTYTENRQVVARIARGLRPTDTCKPKVIRGKSSALEDGEHFGYIRALNGVEMNFDEAEFLTGDEANQAAIEDGFIEEGDTVPNDYYIRNEEKTVARLRISRDVTILVETSSMDGMVGPAPADVSWLWCALVSKDPRQAGHAHSPYWIEVTDGVVTRIEEQYLP